MKYTPILTADLMRQCDSHTINTVGVPSQALMERAARGVVAYLLAHPQVFPVNEGNVLVLCGSGNNGGDGFAVARFLHEAGITHVSVCYGGKRTTDGTPDKTRMSVECARQYEYVQRMLLPIFAPTQTDHCLSRAEVIIDALFGIGLDRPIEGELAALISAINQFSVPVLAVDIPSGIHGDTGEVMGTAVKATATVTMQALKQGLLLYPGADYAGNIHVCDLGIDLTPAESSHVHLADYALIRAVLHPRARRTHKGTYGRLALVCGSHGMAGAAVLAGKGALRSGAGLIQVITPECNRTVLQSTLPEAIISCYDSVSPQLKKLTDAVKDADGLVIGCGLGTSSTSLAVLETLLSMCPVRKDFPVVLDADALNLMSGHPRLWETPLLKEGANQVILTPHPAEMSRLTGASVTDILRDPVGAAVSLSARRGVTVLLKDAHTIIASPDGKIFLCPFGNAGMAKGGSGDILAGILGAMAVQCRKDIENRLTLTEIAAAAAALHGMAGNLAAESRGEISMTPSDLVNAISEVTKELSHTQTAVSLGSSLAD
ncbi:MAG: NAD(P)H-hydrate dehydratase [Ruminococcaceae bacterium]|nr:NAD(P)H-hydrate dehydratase [Oscillospiraceae bacterium]